MNTGISAAIASFYIVGMIGCSPGKPTEGQARDAVAAKIKEYGEIIDFVQTNGESLEHMGQKYYKLHYRAATKLGDGWVWRSKGPFFDAGILRLDVPVLSPNIRKIPSGSTYVARGVVQFRQTENGWVVADTTNDQYGYCKPGKSASQCSEDLWKKN